jgi:L-fuconolactonase
LLELASHQNVFCKISGMVTEARWHAWTDGDLAPYFEIVLNAFGPKRLMFGSDWPVVTLASDYGRWVRTFREAIAALTADEQAFITTRTAAETYRLRIAE